MKISFCIPTYNREEYLEPLIKSIAEQKKHSFELEICISDNASSDNTGSKIVELSELYDIEIIYHRNPINIGPDKNYLSAVDLGTGDYCWIFGSDDILENGALSCLERNITSNADIYLCDRKEMSSDMGLIKNPHRRWLSCGSKFFYLKNNADRLDYFDYCQSVGGVFSYLSSIIVKRSRWSKVKFDENYDGTAYAHAYILLSILNSIACCKLHYIAEPLVLCRGDNDSFATEGVAKRILIDLKGYTMLADEFYPENSAVRNAFLSIIERERPWLYTSLVIGKYNKEKEFLMEVARCYKKMGRRYYIVMQLFKLGDIAYKIRNIKLIRAFY